MSDGAETETAEAPEVDEATESEARKQGWVPLDEFEGDHDDWTPADEYVKLGTPRQMRKELKKTWAQLKEEKRAREADKREFAERLDRFEKMNKAQRARLYADIEAERKKAVKEGDTERYEELNEQEARLVEQEQRAEPAKKQDTPQVNPDVDNWVGANPWFMKDRTLKSYAISVHEQLLEDEPGLDITENLAKVRKEVVKRFPEKFGKQANGSAPRQNAVESGQRIPAAKAGKSWSEIPADDRKIIQRHIEEGLYKDQGEAAKAYWS